VDRVGKGTFQLLGNGLLDGLWDVGSTRLVHGVANSLSLGVLAILACGVVDLLMVLEVFFYGDEIVKRHTGLGRLSSRPAGAFFCTDSGTCEPPVAWEAPWPALFCMLMVRVVNVRVGWVSLVKMLIDCLKDLFMMKIKTIWVEL
jgi:hypothetical protein